MLNSLELFIFIYGFFYNNVSKERSLLGCDAM
jgi:hypothetical protein